MISLICLMLTVPIAGPRYAISFKQGNFEVTRADSKESLGSVPVNPKPPVPGIAVNFSTSKVKMQWNQNGLTIDTGNNHYATAFRAVPTSPRLRTAEEIHAALDAAHTQGRKLTASALSGWSEKDGVVSLIVTWQDRPGQAWLSALERINLTDDLPRPVTEAVLPGVPFTGLPIDQKVIEKGDNILLYLHSDTGWGRWAWNRKTKKSDYLEFGKNAKYVKGTSNGQVQAVEKTSWGTYMAKLEDGISGRVLIEQEFQRLPKFISPDLPDVVALGGSELTDLRTGSVLPLDPGAKWEPVKGLLLIWFGGSKPTKAWLMSPVSWTPMSWWPT